MEHESNFGRSLIDAEETKVIEKEEEREKRAERSTVFVKRVAPTESRQSWHDLSFQTSFTVSDISNSPMKSIFLLVNGEKFDLKFKIALTTLSDCFGVGVGGVAMIGYALIAASDAKTLQQFLNVQDRAAESTLRVQKQWSIWRAFTVFYLWVRCVDRLDTFDRSWA